jgi:hypothetical protein
VYTAFKTVLQEEELFVNIGGAGCHRPTVGVPFTAEGVRKQLRAGVELADLPDGLPDELDDLAEGAWPDVLPCAALRCLALPCAVLCAWRVCECACLVAGRQWGGGLAFVRLPGTR